MRHESWGPTARKAPFYLHRLALRIADPELPAADLLACSQDVSGVSPLVFAEFLTAQGLASVWHARVGSVAATDEQTASLLTLLKRERLKETALYLAQKIALAELDSQFVARGITYAVIKGAHVREAVYTDPAQRPAQDIDILIFPAQRELAAHTLVDAGYRLQATAENISHQATFTRGLVTIDLHWDVLRPGRFRKPIVESLLGRRRRIAGIWGLDDPDVAFLMLVHPAFNKYVCSSNMALIAVLDFVLWAKTRNVDWNLLAKRLDDAGVKTAAWIFTRWQAMLLPTTIFALPDQFIRSVEPNRLRKVYLMFWLQRDLPTRWLHRPKLIQLGFTLPLHDRIADAINAVFGWIRSRRMTQADPLLAMENSSIQPAWDVTDPTARK